jgi:hypothetical protein
LLAPANPLYSAFGHFSLAYILSLHRREESVAACQREAPEGGQSLCLAGAYDTPRRKKEADAALEETIREHAGSEAFWIALMFANRRQDTRTFEWLDRCIAKRIRPSGTYRWRLISIP